MPTLPDATTASGLPHIKHMLMEKWDLVAEFDALLGTGKGSVRRCFNTNAHSRGDSSPSLSFHPKTGAWKCFGCGEKGDYFSLAMKIQQVPFAQVLETLLKKYDLYSLIMARTRAPKASKGTGQAPLPGKARVLTDVIEIAAWQEGIRALKTNAEYMDFLAVRYGLSPAVIEQYGLGVDRTSKRLLIPVWAHQTGQRAGVWSDIVNVRKHDAFRQCALWRPVAAPTEKEQILRPRPRDLSLANIRDDQLNGWEPAWTMGKHSKTLSVSEYGNAYLYPYEILFHNASLYVVGGELKALLLLSLGIPAVTFTTGEGNTAEDFLPCFLGKRVRVLMDVDHAGVIGAMKVAKELAEWGAYVEVGHWPEEIRKLLPRKGDVTDFLRGADWNPDALELIEWKPVVRESSVEHEDLPTKRALVAQEVPWDLMEKISFSDLVNAPKVGTWVRWTGLIAGRAESPWAIPTELRFKCPEGQSHPINACRKCVLPTKSFQMTYEVPLDVRLQWTGLPPSEVDRRMKDATGVPPSCLLPEIQKIHGSIEPVIMSPPVDYEGDDASFRFELRHAYIAQPYSVEIRENAQYEFGGMIISDPKTSKFSTVVTQYHANEKDIFHFHRTPEQDGALHKYFRLDSNGPQWGVDRLLKDLTEHVTYIYGSEGMLLSILLSFFLPFQFNIGPVRNDRICPSVLILGDTTVGKSTVTQRLIRHMGAGRFKATDTKPTYAGLIGGNQTMSNGQMAFGWGIIPNSHRGLLALDEFNKLQPEEIGGFTSLLSSGIAQRTTVKGAQQTRAHVRFLYLANPRSSNKLRALVPAEEVLKVMGTPQDMGRLDFFHIQPEPANVETLLNIRSSPDPAEYTPELAKHHLSWAWSMEAGMIVFESDDYLIEASAKAARRWGHSNMLLAGMARWKVGRLAAAFALLTFSVFNGIKVKVLNAHVDQAVQFLHERYAPWMKETKDFSILPPEISTILDRVKVVSSIRTWAAAPRWTRDDLKDWLGYTEANEMNRQLAQLGFTHRNGEYHVFAEPSTRDLLMGYLAERIKQELR